MKPPNVEVIADPRGVRISIMEFDASGNGSGVSTHLTRRAAEILASKLFAILVENPATRAIADLRLCRACPNGAHYWNTTTERAVKSPTSGGFVREGLCPKALAKALRVK
jgi:hypothetical protein